MNNELKQKDNNNIFQIQTMNSKIIKKTIQKKTILTKTVQNNNIIKIHHHMIMIQVKIII